MKMRRVRLMVLWLIVRILLSVLHLLNFSLVVLLAGSLNAGDADLALQISYSSRSSSPHSLILSSHTPVNTPPPQLFNLDYPPLPYNFNVFNYYWPGPTGSQFSAISRTLPNYPDCLCHNAGESMPAYRVRVSGYRELVDSCIYKLETRLRKQFKQEGKSKLECEKMIGMYYLVSSLVVFLTLSFV
jgi:hypothetical protein